MKLTQKIALSFALLLASLTSLQAQETGGAKGKIRNSQDRGIGGVTVTIEQDGKTVRTASTDKNGAFLIDGLKSGKYNFVFARTGFATGTLNNVEVGGKKVRDLGSRMLEVDKGMLVLIEGSVFDENGRSVYGAKVEIEKISGSGGATAKPRYTNVSGDFAFQFPEGTAKYRVTASAKGKTASKEVEVDSAARYRLAITLNIGEKSEKDQK